MLLKHAPGLGKNTELYWLSRGVLAAWAPDQASLAWTENWPRAVFTGKTNTALSI